MSDKNTNLETIPDGIASDQQAVGGSNQPVQQQNGEEVTAVSELALDTTELTQKDKSSRRERKRTSSAFAESLSTPQGRAITTGVFTSLAVAILFFIAITPALASISRQLEVNSQLREKISNMQAKQQNLLTLTQKEQNYANRLSKFNLLMSEDKHQSAIYAELLDYSNRSNLDFRSVTFSDEAQVRKYEDLGLSERAVFQQVRLVTAGRLDSTDDLVNFLETSKRIYDITDIAITVPNVNQRTVLQIEVTMNTLYWAIPE